MSYKHNVLLVLKRLSKLIEDDELDAEYMVDDLDAYLDDLLGNDAFGTEGQNDPRGDMRDGIWELVGGNIQQVH